LNDLVDLRGERVEVGSQTAKHLRPDAFALACEAKEHVLRADVLVVQPERLFTSHREDLPNPLREIEALHRVLPRPHCRK
jgi:hypothetical protein